MNSLNKYPDISYNKNTEESLTLYITDSVENKCNNEVINRFFKLLNSQFTIYHKVSDYSKQLRIKPKNLLRLFKKERLKNPSKLIKLKLLSEAKKQLIYTDKSIRDICFDLGFYDPSYFSRFFKMHVGITANRFRQQSANEKSVLKMEKSAI